MAHQNGITISTYEFFKTFPNERAAIDRIEVFRWPHVIVCPFCKSERTTRLKAYPCHGCNDCRKKFTVRTGTVFERSHISLDKWLYATYLLQTARKGVSSLQLSKELGNHADGDLVHAPPPAGGLRERGSSTDRGRR